MDWITIISTAAGAVTILGSILTAIFSFSKKFNKRMDALEKKIDEEIKVINSKHDAQNARLDALYNVIIQMLQ